MRTLLASFVLIAPLVAIAGDDPVPAEPTPTRLVADPSYDKYFDQDVLTRGWADLDPVALTDAVLQLAEGERVLLREHRGGLSAKRLFPVALKAAAERGDKATLERLAKAAQAPALADFAPKVKVVQELSKTRRAAGPALTITGGEIDPASVAAFTDVTRDIKHARLLGDKEALKEIADRLAGYADLTDDQLQFLKKSVATAIEDAPAEPDASAAVLRQLGGAARYGQILINTDAGQLPVTKSPTDSSPVAKLTLRNPGKTNIEVKMIGTGRTYTLSPNLIYSFTVYGKVYAQTAAVPAQMAGKIYIQTVPNEAIKIIPPIAEFYTYAAGTHERTLANGDFDVIMKSGMYTIKRR